METITSTRELRLLRDVVYQKYPTSTYSTGAIAGAIEFLTGRKVDLNALKRTLPFKKIIKKKILVIKNGKIVTKSIIKRKRK